MKSKLILRFYFIVIGFVFTFVFVEGLCAQQRGPNSESGNFIKNFDKNNDGQVSKDEFKGPDKVFERLDKNQDGYIDESETSKGSPAGRQRGSGDLIRDLDKNDDGQVSKDEFQGPDKAFERLDKNKDGYIDESEAPKGSPAGRKRGSGDLIRDLDQNDDGQVSKDEFKGPDKVFERLDKNQDGYIDESEASKRSPAGRKRGSGDLIRDLDKNDDGQVSKDEFPGPDKAFERLDKNQDGYIDESEAPKGPPSRKRKDKN